MSIDSYYIQVAGDYQVAIERDGNSPYLVIIYKDSVRREFARAQSYEDAEMVASVVTNGILRGKQLNYEQLDA